MNKKILCFLLIGNTLFFNSNLIGSEKEVQEVKKINLNQLLLNLDGSSYQKELYNITKSSNSSKENFYKLDEYNGVTGSLDYNFQKFDKNYSFLGKISYGNFYVEGEEIKNSNSSQVETRVGVEKNLKDLIYSQNQSNLNKLAVSRSIDRLDYLTSLESEKLSLISLYSSYIEKELEEEVNRTGLTTLTLEKKTLEKSYELGAIPKLELDILNYSYRNLELDIERVESEKSSLKERIFEKYGFNLIDYSFENLETISSEKKNLNSYIERIGSKDLEKTVSEKEEIQESIKYLNYSNNVPDLKVGVERDMKNDENRAFLKISKTIFYQDINLDLERDNLLKKEKTLEEKEREIRSERLKVATELASLTKRYEIDRNKSQLEKSKYEVKRVEHKLGKISYTDVMESFNSYVELSIAEKKSKNSLNSYMFEILVRGEK